MGSPRETEDVAQRSLRLIGHIAEMVGRTAYLPASVARDMCIAMLSDTQTDAREVAKQRDE